MKLDLDRRRVRGSFARRVEEMSGQKLFACYACGNCTAGCPVSFAMDEGPHQVIRYALLGMEEELRGLNTYWLCASCLQCTSRCPKGIDIARVMDAVRTLALRDGQRRDRVSVPDIPAQDLERLPQIAFIGGFRKFLS